MRIALFITCVTDTLRPDTGRATVTVLERLGHEVLFPTEQTCCGQMHANSGYQPQATKLMRRFVRVFGSAGSEGIEGSEGSAGSDGIGGFAGTERIDAIVTPSASCAAMVRDQYPRLAQQSGDDALIGEVATLVPMVFELSELIVGVLGVEDVGAYFPHQVTYHPSCHSLRLLRVGDAPLRLLRRVRGIDLVELGEAASCCGFGGTFAVKNADTSTAMLADKLRHVLDSGAEVCTALDNSCLLQIGGGLDRERAGVRTVHLAEILAATEDAPA